MDVKRLKLLIATNSTSVVNSGVPGKFEESKLITRSVETTKNSTSKLLKSMFNREKTDIPLKNPSD